MTVKTLAAAAALATAAAATAHAASIAEIATQDGRFTTLLAAVEAAGLTETLAGPGAFTVFAPLDDAFAALPEGTVEGLLADTDALTGVLTYHVDDRMLASTDFPGGSFLLRPINASERLCVTNAGGVTIADSTDRVANVVVADIRADNGIIHVIDKVLLPGARPDCH